MLGYNKQRGICRTLGNMYIIPIIGGITPAFKHFLSQLLGSPPTLPINSVYFFKWKLSKFVHLKYKAPLPRNMSCNFYHIHTYLNFYSGYRWRGQTECICDIILYIDILISVPINCGLMATKKFFIFKLDNLTLYKLRFIYRFIQCNLTYNFTTLFRV